MSDASPPRAYHHGNLREALLAGAERILERDGADALTLRAAARAVGVTHAAPRNHFGDLTGLLSELAAVGHRRFAAALAAAAEAAGPDPIARRRAVGRAYVRFAADNPGLFTLMFRSERLDAGRPALRDAIAKSRASLQSIASRPGVGAHPPLDGMAAAVGLWSLVHGFAVLLLDGRLEGALAALPGTTPDSLFDAMLSTLTLKEP